MFARGLVVGLALVSSACGAAGQYVYGFSERAERTTTRTRNVRIADLPPDAHVERLEPDGTAVPLKSRIDLVSYDVHETIDVPRSRMPMYLGTGLDLAVAGASGFMFTQVDDDAKPAIAYLVAYSISAFIADLAFSIYYSIDQEPVVVAYEPAESKPVTYVGYLGENVRRTTIDAAVDDRVDIDFARPAVMADRPATPAEPGGPRLAATLPQPPPTPLASIPLPKTEPPQKVEESWYGWQTLPLDILSVVGLIYGTANEDLEMALGFAALNLTAVPLVHMVHGQPEKSGASFGLRLGTGLGSGLVGGAIGLLLSPLLAAWTDANVFEITGLFAALFGGYGYVALSPVVAVLDGAALAWEPDEVEPSLEIVPSAGRTDDGRPTFGLAGRF